MRRAAVMIGYAALVAGGFALGSTAAFGQQVRPPMLPPPQDPQTTVPEKIDPPLRRDGDDTTGTLSDRLRDSRGVITPPAGVDPGIRVPAPVPNPGTTPVIPPPGAPGGADAPTPR
jgi:multidrug efflux pump subunit AcrA (membrane-fusion protein)